MKPTDLHVDGWQLQLLGTEGYSHRYAHMHISDSRMYIDLPDTAHDSWGSPRCAIRPHACDGTAFWEFQHVLMLIRSLVLDAVGLCFACCHLFVVHMGKFSTCLPNVARLPVWCAHCYARPKEPRYRKYWNIRGTSRTLNR